MSEVSDFNIRISVFASTIDATRPVHFPHCAEAIKMKKKLVEKNLVRSEKNL